MQARFCFALTAGEMGLSPTLLALIVVASIVSIVGFAKNSRENEYKKLMDSFIKGKMNLIYLLILVRRSSS
tara:strand:+ start:214 stop:426 length:213 start_codon:yes stop_codon:yes gene_type:complete